MPRRETRHDIERALAGQRRSRQLARGGIEHLVASIEARKARIRQGTDPAERALQQAKFEDSVRLLTVEVRRRRRRRPGDGSMPVLVEPPRGPKPLAGGAAAPLEFD